MKRLVVLLVVCCLAGKTTAQSLALDSSLELKRLLESHFTGTTIRDLAVEFELKRDAVGDNYKLTGRIRQLVESVSVEALLRKIATLYTPADTISYTGTVYFDRYTDSAIVDVYPINGDRIFHAISHMPSPQDGLKAFSRRFHDFLRNQIETGLVYDTLANLSTFRFIVERDGSLISLDTGIAKALFEAFEQQETRWSLGIWSGAPSRNEVVLNIISQFIHTGQGWPDEYEWVNITELPHFDIGKQLTYCTMNKASIPPGMVVISAIRDPLSRAYRMPMIHDGTAEEAELLINDVKGIFKRGDPIRNPTTSYRRIYFYRDNR
ncbi:hypothetical protein [Parapedobacter sp. DT-150]|uniref:hypothetical protein n=1 Tax=Parapedobacter sp. DT-150 TaxID=3396162 RepID=UPI003F1C8427